MSLMVVISYANKKRAEPSGHGSTRCRRRRRGTLVKILPSYDFREGDLINLEFESALHCRGYYLLSGVDI